MKAKTKPMDDPVVTEVRAIRAKLCRDAGGTVKGLLDLLKREGGRNHSRRRRGNKNRTASIFARRKAMKAG